MDASYDAIIIGTGQAGPPLAARLAAGGMKVAVIEQGKFGGTCVNNGCIPTKTLVASAYAAHSARRSAEYGVEIGGPVQLDMRRVKARKDDVSGRSNRGVENWMRGLANATVYGGHARFTGPKTVRVNDGVLGADRIFINVGGRPLVPDMPGLDLVPHLTNVSMMDVDFLPEHLLVIGGSYVGLEFGQMYRRFGSRVTIIEMGPRLIGREDEDVSRAVHEILQQEGIGLRLDAECLSLARDRSGIAVNLKCASGASAEVGSHVLLAVGRVPNTDDLGLDAAGIQIDRRGYVVVDEALRTTNPNVWALGDCNGKGAFTHTSYNDYEIVADNLLNGGRRKWTDRVTAYALFIDPPLGRVGMTEAEVKRAGIPALAAKRPMTRVARAVEKGEPAGFMKVVVDARDQRILGAAILGTGGDEVVHSLLDVVYAGLPYTAVQRGVRIHPTVSELIPTLLGDLQPLA
ncbi:MAG TPA: FAD-containing oxidoreductase [Burkholderiales bacterium]|nr:FAD-containing oxidoreductase [Burkholderiales bacterium]